MSGSALFCEHANENPAVCPCDRDCFCYLHTCKHRAVYAEALLKGMTAASKDDPEQYSEFVQRGESSVKILRVQNLVAQIQDEKSRRIAIEAKLSEVDNSIFRLQQELKAMLK